MDRPLRIGVIGAGWFASRRHLPDIARHDEVRLAAVCRRDPASLDHVADHFEAERRFTDWRCMLEECPLDAALIATPHDQHYAQAHDALERGLHVLVEKPMTLTGAEARELKALAEHRGLVLGVALNPPFWAHCHRIRSAIRAGRIGEIESASFYWTGNALYVFGQAERPADLPGLVPPTLYRADPLQCGGGYFIDGGSHLVSELLWVSGLRAARVAALTDASPSDRRATVALMLENGAAATISSIGDSHNPGRRVRNTFGGSRGTITVEGLEFQTTIAEAEGEPETFREEELPRVAGPVANFVDAIRGRAALLSDAAHGAHVTEVVEAVYRSAATGQAIAIGPQSDASGGR